MLPDLREGFAPGVSLPILWDAAAANAAIEPPGDVLDPFLTGATLRDAAAAANDAKLPPVLLGLFVPCSPAPVPPGTFLRDAAAAARDAKEPDGAVVVVPVLRAALFAEKSYIRIRE